MAWLKVDDGFHDHPKVDELSLEAVGLWLLCATWCQRHLTDGEVPGGRVQKFGGTFEVCSELVRANMWRTSENVRDGAMANSYFFVNWCDWNHSKEQVEEEREKARIRMQNLRSGTPDKGKRSGDVRPNTARTSGDVRDPIPSHPIPISNAHNDAHFDAFWNAYPRRKAKKEARKKFDKAIKDGATPEALIDGAKAYAESMTGKEEKYIAYPTTWLNQGRWEDEADAPTPKPFDLWNSGGPI